MINTVKDTIYGIVDNISLWMCAFVLVLGDIHIFNENVLKIEIIYSCLINILEGLYDVPNPRVSR